MAMFPNNYFRSPAILIRSADGEIEERPGPGRRIVMTPRSQCVAFALRAPQSLDRSKRNAALMLEARRRAPFENPGLHVHDEGEGHAFAWVWDADAAPDVSAFPDIDLADVVHAPETALLDVDRHDGARLVRRQEGVEGLIWREGRLLASRWWPAPPQVDQWRAFLKTVGFEEPEEPALQDREPFATRPWTKPLSDARFELALSATAERRALRYGGAVAAACFLFAAGSLAQGLAARAGAGWEAAQARSKAAEILDARSAALIDADASRVMIEALDQIDLPVLLAAVDEALTPAARVVSFNVENGRLELAVGTGVGAGRAAQVAAGLETSEYFENVRVEDGGGRVAYRLVAELSPR